MKSTPLLIILAAGEGSRMNSDRPKVLSFVCGRPLIGHVLAAADALSPARVMVVTAPGQDAVRAAVAPADCCVQEEPLGTGDAVRVALEALGTSDGPVVIAYGDMPLVTGEALLGVVDALPDHGAGISVLGFHLGGAHTYGRLVLGDDGALLRIVEAADADALEKAITFCNSGLMAASSGDLLGGLVQRLTPENAKAELYLTDVIGLARGDGIPCAAVPADAETLIGVNSRADLAVAEATMQTRLRGAAMAAGTTLVDPTTVYLSFDTRFGRDVVVGPHVWFGPGVTVGDGVEIRPYCHIEGAVIGAEAIIGPFARLRPGADIGADAHIGNFVEVKEARVEAGAKINHLAYIGDARIGAGANIGAGTITCNYDGFHKHRTEIGAGVFIGSNTALVAPVVIGDGAVIGAGSVITGKVPADALAVARGKQKTVPGGGAKYRALKSGAASGKKSRGEG
ncbi:MAG: bifunctional UDP-N-acetylglucosamine diphosphorylase/glucosamine-1-phosphate N-acetyltransferase GlmU [Alphaproteobacteria bacterium]